jgi:hypothetical protein
VKKERKNGKEESWRQDKDAENIKKCKKMKERTEQKKGEKWEEGAKDG